MYLLSELYDQNLEKLTAIPCVNFITKISALMQKIATLGLLWGDIKPSNFVVSEKKQRIRLVDCDIKYWARIINPSFHQIRMLAWCNLLMVFLHFSKNFAKNQKWWFFSVGPALKRILEQDWVHFSPQCARWWHQLSKLEAQGQSNFVDPFFVSHYYLEGTRFFRVPSEHFILQYLQKHFQDSLN